MIIRKTDIKNQKVAQVVLFSTDLELSWNNLIEYYRLRFQIEFNFRDAKQCWGLDDFMNIRENPIHNAANLSLFMVNLSYALRQKTLFTGMSVLDLKAWFRAGKYVRETLKSFPQIAEDNFIYEAIANTAHLGRINASSVVG